MLLYIEDIIKFTITKENCASETQASRSSWKQGLIKT